MARRTSVHPVTQEDEYSSSDDGSDESPGLPYSTQELEQETFISLVRDQTLDGQIPAGPYILVLSKPTGEIMSDARTKFRSTIAYPCPVPWDSCPGPPRSEGGSAIDAGCHFCWMCSMQIQVRIRAAGFFQPTHNLFHWGPKTQYGSHSCHAYAIGPIFDADHAVAIGRIVRDFQFEGCPDYPALGPYILFHLQGDDGVGRNDWNEDEEAENEDANEPST